MLKRQYLKEETYDASQLLRPKIHHERNKKKVWEGNRHRETKRDIKKKALDVSKARSKNRKFRDKREGARKFEMRQGEKRHKTRKIKTT